MNDCLPAIYSARSGNLEKYWRICPLIGGYERFCIFNRTLEKQPISSRISEFSQNAKRPVRFELAEKIAIHTFIIK